MNKPAPKLLPHCTISEQGVIGSLILDPNFLTAAQLILPPGKVWFYDLRHQTIYDCLCKMDEEGVAIDAVTIAQKLKANGQLEQVGGLSDLAGLADAVPSAANVTHYAKVVHSKYVARGIIRLCTEVAKRTEDYPDEVDPLLEELRSGVDRLGESTESKLVDPPSSTQRLIEDLERRYNLNGALSGIATGFSALDHKLDGLQYGEQIIIGARPSIGKTAIGLNIARNACFNEHPTLFVTLESPVESLMRRLLAADKNISMGNLRSGRLTEFEFKTVTGFVSRVRASKLFFLQSVGGIDVSTLLAQVRSVIRKHNIKLVVIDYLTKIKSSERHEKRTYEVGDISGRLKALAEQSKIALVTLAQLSRENEKEKGRAPKLADLAESGQIERDADTVILLHRDRSESDGDAQLIIAKQRDGETGVVNLKFNGKYCRFENPT